MYHVALDLSQEQAKGLKVLAATNGIPVFRLVTNLVVEELKERKKEEDKKQV